MGCGVGGLAVGLEPIVWNLKSKIRGNSNRKQAPVPRKFHSKLFIVLAHCPLMNKTSWVRLLLLLPIANTRTSRPILLSVNALKSKVAPGIFLRNGSMPGFEAGEKSLLRLLNLGASISTTFFATKATNAKHHFDMFHLYGMYSMAHPT